jgi:hypothetical protein
MAMFVHLAPETRAKAIVRSGIRLPRAGGHPIRGVFAFPFITGYGSAHAAMSAAEAVAVILNAGDAQGFEVIGPRGVRPGEIHALREPRQVLGWRCFPGSHRKRPCGCPACQGRGEFKSRKLRERD